MVRERLMALWKMARNPKEKPPYVEHMERRQDDVERRLSVLSVDGANQAQHAVHASGRR